MANNLSVTAGSFNTTTPIRGSASLKAGNAVSTSAIAPSASTGNATDYTLEFEFRSAAVGGVVVMASFDNGKWIGINGSGQVVANMDGNTVTSSASFADSAVHRAEIGFSSSGFVLLVGGVLQGTSTYSFSFAGLKLYLGQLGTAGYSFPGELDQVAFWPGQRHTASYTPATATYTGTEGMIALYQLDGDGTDSANPAGAPAYSVYANNAGILYSPGNWDVTSARARTNCGGGYYRTVVTNLPGSSLTMGFDTSALVAPFPQVTVILDGTTTTYTVASTITVPVPTANAWSYHTVDVIVKSTTQTQDRWNSAATAVQFLGITTSGVTCSLPVANPLKLVIAGDSITEGVLTLSTTATPDTNQNDATFGWAYLQRRFSGAEVGVIGFGGTGITTAGGGNVPAIGDFILTQYSGGPARSLAGVDLVILNPGTNDRSSIQAGYTALLNKVLGAPGFTGKIMALQPFAGTYQADIQAAIAACSDPTRCIYQATAGWYDFSAPTGGTHPLGWLNLAVLGPKLAAAIRTAMGTSTAAAVVKRWTHS